MSTKEFTIKSLHQLFSYRNCNSNINPFNAFFSFLNFKPHLEMECTQGEFVVANHCN